jgi:YD repeat-containing protein
MRSRFIYHDGENYTEVIDSLGRTEYHYDDRSICTKIIYPDHTQTREEYNDRMELVSEIDEQGLQTTYTYNDWSQPLSITRPGGAEALYEYDGLGRLTRLTNPEGASLHWSYNDDGTVRESVDELSAATAYTYNENKLLETVLNVKGDIIRLEYDPSANLSRVTLPDGTAVSDLLLTSNPVAAQKWSDARRLRDAGGDSIFIRRRLRRCNNTADGHLSAATIHSVSA